MAGGGGHRSTLKQNNKSHNHGKHRSKRNMKREAHGRVNVKQLTKKKATQGVMRQEIIQNRADGRQQVWNERRGATSTPPPRLVVVISLNEHVDMTVAVDMLKEADISSQTVITAEKVLHVSSKKWKKQMSFFVPDFGDLQSALDAAKVADIILFIMTENGIDKYGEQCLTCVLAQGIPGHIFACQGLKNLNKTKLLEAQKKIEKQVEKRFPGHRACSIDTWQDAQTLWRQLANLNLKTVHFHENRPYMLAEKLEFELNSSPDQQETISGTLKVSGYLRGHSLDVNQLIHLPGWGDFQMSQIDETSHPYPLTVNKKDRRHNKKDMMEDNMIEATYTLARATRPESLQSEVIPDSMDEEQTWPTAEELEESKTIKVKTPKGVSDYQQQWMLGLEATNESGDDDDCESVDDAMMERNTNRSPDALQETAGEDNQEDIAEEITDEQEGLESYDEQMDMAEESRMLEVLREERQHVHFPDEVDTPQNVPARTRFARYRGLDNFHSSSWDPNESLPCDYARIYRVSKHHYKSLRKLSRKGADPQEDNLVAEPGNFITVYVKNVPHSFIETHKPGSPVTLFGLFLNEQKMTLISALLARTPGFTAPVKSKDPLIFQIGFRRFSACPIFSEHAFQNKYKMERFLPQSGFIVASMYAPIMFTPSPVLAFRENVVGKMDLVAKGSLLPLDTDRIIVKRVVLSGAPFKINKKTVVVRYMFFNREDVEYYKPLEVRTKRGKRGHIMQALGTHGHMKCTFNGQLTSEDTVILNLYKRVFPKWSFNPHVGILPPYVEREEIAEERQGFEMFD